jgi:glycosyltransferase involved in cell wall biosynthesis
MNRPDKLKIAYILPDFDEYAHSGGLYVIFEHCNGLIKRGHSVRVFNDTGKKSLYLRLDCDVERHYQDPSRIESARPDIIVGTHWRTYYLLNKLPDVLKNDTKLFLLVQSDDRFLVGTEMRPLVNKALTDKHRGIAPIYKIAISRYLQEILRNDFGQDSFYIRNGFEPRTVRPLLYKTDRIRIVARYDTSKYRGWELVDSALEKISKEHSDVEIHLFEMKDKRSTSYKSIFHKGLTGDRLLSLFKSCDIYIAGSSYEGFSYPAIEAMSQGCAVCCTDAGGNREFCIDNETALMSRRDDPEGLYKNLKKIVTDKVLRGDLSSRGIDKAKEFGWGDNIVELEKAFIVSSAVKYGNIDIGANPDKAPEGKIRSSVLFVYGKDPFLNYIDWLKIEETIKFFGSGGDAAQTILFIDRHPARAVRGRLEMLTALHERRDFKFISCYNKRIKLPSDLFKNTIFALWIAAILLRGHFFANGAFKTLVIEEWDSGLLRSLCRLLNINYNTQGFDERALGKHDLGSCTAEYPVKEGAARRLIRENLLDKGGLAAKMVRQAHHFIG